MQMGQFNQRCLGVLQLRSKTFQEISEDPAAFRQAGAIVVAVGLIGLGLSLVGDQDALGDRIFDKLAGDDTSSALRATAGGILNMAITLAIWLLEATVVRFLGTHLGQPAHSLTLQEVAAPIGFIRLIDVLTVLYGVAIIGRIASVFSLIWGIAAGVTIAKLLFSVGTGRALVIYLLTFALLGIPAIAILVAT